MPTTEQCPKGVELGEKIKALDDVFRDFRDETRGAIVQITSLVVKLENHYSKRPQWYLVLIIGSLVGIISTLSTYIIMSK